MAYSPCRRICSNDAIVPADFPCRRICTNKTNVPADLQSAGIEYKDFQSAYFLFSRADRYVATRLMCRLICNLPEYNIRIFNPITSYFLINRYESRIKDPDIFCCRIANPTEHYPCGSQATICSNKTQ